MTINLIYNRADEEQVLRTENAIICFSASWCSPCQKFKPIYSQIADRYKHLKFFKVDIDDNEDFTNKFEIKSIPTFVFLKNGEKINEYTGIDEIKLISILQEL